ncbi:zinc-ribbon domain-containing protein [Glaciecola sp. SC05]|uniref:zinc-ribbon domain-containing protein n=1 Tax=Glaciecola sp. SC05 TaxID=1987355 RepID=UPI003529CDCC
MSKPKIHQSLQSRYPEVAKEWHPTKNGALTPEDVFPKSDKKAWFLCSNNNTHEWYTRLADRTSKSSGCPFCYRRVTPETSLAAKHPEIAQDWHPTKNIDITPKQVAPKSNKYFWWVCSKGHEYKMQPTERVSYHRGCTECAKFGWSAQETRIYCEIKALFPGTKYRYKVKGSEIDVYIQSIRIGIEYDGHYYHHSKAVKDRDKNIFMKKQDVAIVRVREHPLPKLSLLDVITPAREISKQDVDALITSIVALVPSTANMVSDYLKETEFVNDDEFLVYMSYFPDPFPEKSLAVVYPEVASQWDHRKNHPLTPYNFTHGSHHRIWWKCAHGHSFQRTINHMTGSRDNKYKGCIACRNAKKLPPNDAQLDIFD